MKTTELKTSDFTFRSFFCCRFPQNGEQINSCCLLKLIRLIAAIMSSLQASSTPNRLLSSEFDRIKVDSLIAWLKTFPQFDALTENPTYYDSIEWLSLTPVAR